MRGIRNSVTGSKLQAPLTTHKELKSAFSYSARATSAWAHAQYLKLARSSTVRMRSLSSAVSVLREVKEPRGSSSGARQCAAVQGRRQSVEGQVWRCGTQMGVHRAQTVRPWTREWTLLACCVRGNNGSWALAGVRLSAERRREQAGRWLAGCAARQGEWEQAS